MCSTARTGSGRDDLVVAYGLDNSVGVALQTTPGLFGPPLTLPVGMTPSDIAFADVDGDQRLDILVSDQASGDVSDLLNDASHSFANSYRSWVAMPGPRLNSGGIGPVATTLRDVNHDGIPDLVVTDGQSGTIAVLPGRGQGFFDDRNPLVLTFPGDPSLLSPSFIGSSNTGVVATGDGRLFGFNLDQLTTSLVFSAAGNRAVAAVQALSDGRLVVAGVDGVISVLGLNPTSGLYESLQDLPPLTGIPSAPSALEVLEGAFRDQVFVTSEGDDRVFVFALDQVSLPEPELVNSVSNTTALADAQLAVVVTLVAGTLEEGVTNRVPSPPPELPGQPGEDVEESEEEEFAWADSEFVPDVDNALRSLDLYQPTEEPGLEGLMSLLENMPEMFEIEPSMLTALLESLAEDTPALADE